MEKAIKLAIEGGYEPFKTIRLTSADKIEKTDFETLTLMHQGTELGRARINLYRVLLDHLFWSSLGKAMGWDSENRINACEYCSGTGTCPDAPEMCAFCMGDGLGSDTNHWMNHWHRFIDHLAEGGEANEFFDNLLRS